METLSYNNKTQRVAGEDWIAVDPYSDDEIDRIQDPDGGLAENPRTAIPSPFAQIDLVRGAFKSVAQALGLRAPRMNARLVSNALDVAQLMFDYENHRERLRIVCWNRDEQLAALRASEAHRLYGETLDLFLRADTAYNFDRLTRWYILMVDGRVVGGTSPASIFMAAPAVPQFDNVMVEQGVPLFSTVRHLHERDADFVYYFFLLLNAYPDLRQLCQPVYAYAMACLPLLQRERPDVYRRIVEAIPNPAALDPSRAAEWRARLEATFDAAPFGMEVGVLGAKFYSRRRMDIRALAASSDFVIAPTVTQPAGSALPLVLVTGHRAEGDTWRYLDREWDSATQVLTGGKTLEERLLPDTAVQYPFLTTIDLLQPTLLRVPAPIDGNHFVDATAGCRHSVDGMSYLLPVAPSYFDYFTVADLTATVGGKPALTIDTEADGTATVTLRVPVKKGHIEMRRRYMAVGAAEGEHWTFDEQRGTGRIMDVAIDLSVFPMVRTGEQDDYTVQLFTMLPAGSRATLALRRDADGIAPRVSSKRRTATETFTTTYHDVAGTWDRAELTVHAGRTVATGVIVPRWTEARAGSKQLLFAVDFGTTNTHVEWAERGTTSRPLTFEAGGGATLVGSLLKTGGLDLADQVQRIEFLPPSIDDVYGFPLRTALLRPAVNDGQTKLFHDVSVPFLYERQYFGGYDVATGLKWLGDSAPAREFLREMVLLVRARVLLEQADPRRTVVTYFFPVSMGGSDRRRLQQAWEELYRTYLGPDTATGLHCFPESVAPTFYYRGAEAAAGSSVGIDIGGGTTDVVIYQPTADGLHSHAVAVSSFRFAGNAIFGDAFDRPDAEHNPLLKHYGAYFDQLATGDRTGQITYLSSILHDVMRRGHSEDVNAFLFSIENVEQLRGLREVDRNRYSYNCLLRADSDRKLVFAYFYSAIIYYVATSMRQRDMVMPREVYFSGTGSKILAIVGGDALVTDLTREIFERVYNRKFDGPFAVRIEADAPKQITCRGGIRLTEQLLAGGEAAQEFSPRAMAAIKYSHPMADLPSPLSLDSLLQPASRAAIVSAVEEFNRFFINLIDKTWRDELGIDATALRLLDDIPTADVDAYLTAGINAWLTGRYEPTDAVEDVPFFYPVAGIIRLSLLPRLGYKA